MARTVQTFQIPHQYPITLSVERRIGPNDRHVFAVTYGAEHKGGLTHEQAASVLGFALMHAMECNGFQAQE